MSKWKSLIELLVKKNTYLQLFTSKVRYAIEGTEGWMTSVHVHEEYIRAIMQMLFMTEKDVYEVNDRVLSSLWNDCSQQKIQGRSSFDCHFISSMAEELDLNEWKYCHTLLILVQTVSKAKTFKVLYDNFLCEILF